MTIPVAHDYTCPWCWVGLFQSKRLHEEFGVTFEWLPYELYPEELPWPEVVAKVEDPPGKPPIPSRFQLMLAAENMELPKVERPKRMRIKNAFLATELAKEHGVADPMVDALYRAYWEDGLAISDRAVLRAVAGGLGIAPGEIDRTLDEGQYANRIVHFDQGAYSVGVYNVPTFFIGGQRYAEQPYRVLREAVAKATKDAA